MEMKRHMWAMAVVRYEQTGLGVLRAAATALRSRADLRDPVDPGRWT